MRNIIFSFLFLLALASCGDTGTAKSQAKDYMNTQMGLKDYDVIAWSNLDSTHHVTDSMLSVMQRDAVKRKIAKSTTKWQPRTEKLNLLTVRYTLNSNATHPDTIMNTFYFDDKMQGIVGVK